MIYRFQLAHLRVFQIIVFRVRLSCPWRKTDQKFRDQIKFLKLYSILCYNCWVLQPAHLCYWQPTWPSHPVFLSGCFFFFLAIPNVIYLGSKALHIIGVWDSKIIGTMHFWSIGHLVFSASSSSSRWLHLSRQATSCGRGDLARQFPLGYRRAAVNRNVPPALVHNLYSPLVTACQGLILFWCCQ